METGKRTAQSFKAYKEKTEKVVSSFKKRPFHSKTATQSTKLTPIPRNKCRPSLGFKSNDCRFSGESTVEISMEELKSMFSEVNKDRQHEPISLVLTNPPEEASSESHST